MKMPITFFKSREMSIHFNSKIARKPTDPRSKLMHRSTDRYLTAVLRIEIILLKLSFLLKKNSHKTTLKQNIKIRA